jgi:phosphopantothenoylcysteine synthetase/decarboxylase
MKEDDVHIHRLGIFVRKKAISKLSGHVVQTDYKLPGEADPLPKADAMLAMPVTFNTINKWAQGIGNTLVTSLLTDVYFYRPN